MLLKSIEVLFGWMANSRRRGGEGRGENDTGEDTREGERRAEEQTRIEERRWG